MSAYRYRITVEPVEDAPAPDRCLQFEATDGEDILSMVERMRPRVLFSGDYAAALGVGLKLLAGVALEHSADPMFRKLRPALMEFMRDLKQWPGGEMA